MLLKIYAIALLAVAILTFILYAADKLKAVRGEWRVPEATLLLFSFFGGGIGGYIAMLITRHKTRKWYFHAVNILGILWQLALLVFLIVRYL